MDRVEITAEDLYQIIGELEVLRRKQVQLLQAAQADKPVPAPVQFPIPAPVASGE